MHPPKPTLTSVPGFYTTFLREGRQSRPLPSKAAFLITSSSEHASNLSAWEAEKDDWWTQGYPGLLSTLFQGGKGHLASQRQIREQMNQWAFPSWGNWSLKRWKHFYRQGRVCNILKNTEKNLRLIIPSLWHVLTGHEWEHLCHGPLCSDLHVHQPRAWCQRPRGWGKHQSCASSQQPAHGLNTRMCPCSS